MKHAFFLIAFAFSCTLSWSQILLSCSTPSSPVTLDQLWNVTITSTIIGNSQYALKLEFYDNKSGKVIEQTTSFFQLQPSLIIDFSSIKQASPITNDFVSKDFLNSVTKAGGIVPDGNYTIAYTLFNKVNNNIGETVAHTECPLNIDNSYLLQLINPADNSIITDVLPVFSWVYTGNLQQGCRYEYTLKEMLQNQTASHAMMYNQVYTVKEVNEPLYVYNVFDRPLQQGKKYCWMVKIKCGENYIAVSDVWSFSLTNSTNKEMPKFDPNSFYKIKPAQEGSEILIDDNYLKVKYITDFVDKDGLLNYQLVDAKGKELLNSNTYPLSVTIGDNRYIIELCPSGVLYLKPGKYLFKITDDKGVKYALRFVNKPKVNCE